MHLKANSLAWNELYMHLKAFSLKTNDALYAFEGKQPYMKWCFICIWRQTALHVMMLYMHLKANSLACNDALYAFEGKQPCMKWCFICIWRQTALHVMMLYMHLKANSLANDTLNACLAWNMLYMYLKANSLAWNDALNAFEGKQPCMKWCFICIWRQIALHEMML